MDDPVVKDIPVVFTIHNIGYHGVFPPDALARAGIPQGLFHPGGIEFFGNANFLKGGLIYSDYLTTVSRKYAQEIQTPEFGFGLMVYSPRASRLVGILMEDYMAWSRAHT
jgi:starch synthase